MPIKLGSKIKCKVTELEGIATSYNVHRNGCIRVHIQPTLDKDGKPREGDFVDIQDIEMLVEEHNGPDIMYIPGVEEVKAIVEAQENPGGPGLPTPMPLPTPR